MSQEPQTDSEALSVVDRLAVRLLRIQAYGTSVSARYDEAALSQWRKVLYPHERAEWQRVARELLADIALGDNDEAQAVAEYKISLPEGGHHDGFDDIGDAVDFADVHCPGATMQRRTAVTLHGEWAEVTR